MYTASAGCTSSTSPKLSASAAESSRPARCFPAGDWSRCVAGGPAHRPRHVRSVGLDSFRARGRRDPGHQDRLERHRGNKLAVARELETSRGTLYRRIRRYKLERFAADLNEGAGGAPRTESEEPGELWSLLLNLCESRRTADGPVVAVRIENPRNNWYEAAPSVRFARRSQRSGTPRLVARPRRRTLRLVDPGLVQHRRCLCGSTRPGRSGPDRRPRR
ncbi:hypothetical protein CSX11_32385 [Mycobacterium goodii]|nr:hypothetical protein CSX11_32385 [Mycolicibacterium goodii]